jgi:GNAT superfamily N-acetyltransferase
MTFRIAPIPAVGDNLQSIIWVDRVCFPDEQGALFDGAYWWGAYDEKKLVATASLTYFPEGVGFLSRASVLPGWRGHGLQRKFIQYRERDARKYGTTRMVTYTSRENTVSSNNLIKCGYRLYIPDAWWGLRHGLYWEKDL